MRLLSFEYSPVSYRVDFAFYGTAVVGLSVLLIAEGPRAHAPALAALTVAGLVAWTMIEYVTHRFLMHGLDPIRRWHAKHHRHTTALIGTPTFLSATVMLLLVFLPALASIGVWRASALTLGFLTGYLGYGITHHAVHHWHFDNAWLKRRKRWHALHHELGRPVCYGVTSAFWDYVFFSAEPDPPAPGTRRGHARGSRRDLRVAHP